jgi:hypothetical protein
MDTCTAFRRGDINCRGQNPSGTSICCSTGYSAVAGWDPASGLGSVNFGILRDYVISTAPNVDTPAWTPPPLAPSGGRACPVANPPYLGTPCSSNSKTMSAAGQAVLIGFVVICMVLILVWTVMNGCSNLRGLDSNGNPLHNRHAPGEFLTMGRMHTPSTPGGRLSAQSVDKDYEDEDDEEMLNMADVDA